jgi:exopolysaccharide biosynthesis polyprenyl glycosylphosphotransferase
MFRRFSVNFALFSIGLDASLVILALYIADQMRWRLNVLTFVTSLASNIRLPIELYLIFPLIWIAVLLLVSVYDGRRNLRVVDELNGLTLGLMLSGGLMAGVLYFSFRNVSRLQFLMFIALAFVCQVGWRLIYRVVFRLRGWGGVSSQRVLVLGAGRIGQQIAEKVKEQSRLGMELAGFLDVEPKMFPDVVNCLGTLDDARAVVQAHAIDDVIIALPRSQYTWLNKVATDLHDLPLRVWVIPDYFSLTLHRASVVEFAGIPMLDLRAPALSEYQRMVKRAFDLVVSITSLPVVLPVMGVSALMIRLDSAGSVLLRQERVGENGRLFGMLKFRTMVQGADKLNHLVERTDGEGNILHKSPDDPRITRVGRGLRRASLDELPQLFNVLRGEMSLVGPRPELPHLVEKYERWQRQRFAVPQGVTGWWQIHGRSDRPMHLHTEDDLYYVQHYSIWLDLQIIVRTIWVVLRGKGAY